jgi:hypothetical protein
MKQFANSKQVVAKREDSALGHLKMPLTLAMLAKAELESLFWALSFRQM